MSEPASAALDDGDPAPGSVFAPEDLRTQLARLRRRQGRRTGRRPASLDQLSRQTGIPRSTLHTYLTGTSLPPASVFDAIVHALGCSQAESRAWAGALERVVEQSHAGASRGAMTPTSRFSRFDAEVRRHLDRPTDRWYDLLEHVAMLEQVEISTYRQIGALRSTHTVRAQADGVDRYALRLVPGAAIDLDALRVVDLLDCEVGEHRSLPDLGVRVLEVVFDHALRAGETYVFAMTVDYDGARHPGAGGPACVEALRGFRRRGPMFTLEVRFPAGDSPADLRQVHVSHPEAPENVVRPLHLNRWRSVHVSVAEPAAGLHGVRWRWPSEESASPQLEHVTEKFT